MAEIRTHDTSGGSDLGRLVREALGETIRPIEPGTTPPVTHTEVEVVTVDVTMLSDPGDTWSMPIPDIEDEEN